MVNSNLAPDHTTTNCLMVTIMQTIISHNHVQNISHNNIKSFQTPMKFFEYQFQISKYCSKVIYLLQNNHWLPYPLLHFPQFKGDNGTYAACCNLYIYRFLSQCQLFTLFWVFNIAGFSHCTCRYSPHLETVSSIHNFTSPMSQCHATS